MVEYSITNDNLHIYDSYKVKKRSAMKSELLNIKEVYADKEIFKERSISSMIREWRAHNLLYALHIKRNRTKDVDLNLNQKWYVKIGYFILSILYL